jgi:hypothetical protein
MPHKKESVKNQRIGESGYVLPDHIPSGEVVHGLKSDEDGIKNQSWRIGKSIGKVNRTGLYNAKIQFTDLWIYICLDKCV